MIAARVDGFTYYKDATKSKKYSSQHLVNRILRAFASNQEYYLGTERFISTNDSKGKDQFLIKLVAQLKWATGRTPKLRKSKDGAFSVWYQK